MPKLTLKDLDVKSKRVLVRVDFNVPLENGAVANDIRIRAALPTINYLIENQARVILMSHMGRPKGKRDPKLQMDSVAEVLSRLLGREVKKIDSCVGPEAEKAAASLSEGDILLLENLRFYPEETANDPEFARQLAGLADIYVNDAFGTAHRAHASTAGVAEYLPSAMGFLIEKEVSIMGKALEDPVRPFAAIIGGVKIADKIGVLTNLLEKVDFILIGGGMANTFLKAKGFDMGASVVEEEKLEDALEIIKLAQDRGVELALPVDVVAAGEISPDAERKVVPVDAVPSGMMALDIGPETAEKYAGMISRARTVVWNGPMGVFEEDVFAKGTEAVARAVAEVETSIVGGGDSAAAVEKVGVSDRITHVSTGGGASLEFLEGKVLPGIAALTDK
ncbi:MAG: phosphoglycerate kinase [Bacillota bacterium]|jgi:phosphoglycerate kinase